MENNQYNTSYDVLETEIFEKPIDYVKLTESDFFGLEFSKEPIDIPSGKYLTDVIKPNFYNDKVSNTVVISSSVGQGKSTFAIQVAKNYILPKFPRPDAPVYTVIFAVPYKSLINQYISLIQKEINHIKIPDYNNLVEIPYKERGINSEKASSPNNINYGKRSRIHVMTINCLLGNPGDDAMEQSSIKSKYLEGIIDYAKDKGRKIILIFDEIHAGIQNFKQELIFNLWKFKTSGVLHKSFILSATFNEASKTVINYLAELTDKKLHIYESVRTQQTEKLSNLHLFLTRKRNYKFESDEYVEFFKKIIKEHQHLNILSYSKDNAIKIVQLFLNNDELKSLIQDKKWKINLSISEDNFESLDKNNFENIEFEGKFLKDYCNIGTMFSTGISIEHEDSAYVIILPNSFPSSKNFNNNNLGIFSNGTIPIIQSLARAREKADIYVIMPTPTQLIIPDINDPYNSYIHKLPNIPILEELKETNIEKDLDYYSEYSQIGLGEQEAIIRVKYGLIYADVKKEIDLVLEKTDTGEREYLPSLRYPSKDEFMLKWGEKFLYSKYAIFGKDLSAYMIWAAFNNQFVNCRLKSIISKPTEEVVIEDGHLHDYLYNLFMDIYNSEEHQNKFEICDYILYKDFERNIFSNTISWANNYTQIYKSNKPFQQHIIAFFQKAIKGNKRLHDNYFQKDQSGHVIDIPFKGEDYLLCCMANALIYSNEQLTNNARENNLIETYLNLYKLYQMLLEKIVFIKENNGKKYIYSNFNSFSENPFSDFETDFIIRTIVNIMKDESYKVFRKFDSLNPDNKNDALVKIYKELKKTFFIKTGKSHIDKPIPNTDQTENINIEYIEIIELPKKRTGIDLLYKYEYVRQENYDDLVLLNECDIIGQEFDMYIQSTQPLEDYMPVSTITLEGREYKNEIRTIE
ncbi:hypothetical protein CLV62_10484 [Dysgonomonas alginatilytica]|uniref:Helicase ATP-binding domain-containing protein n=1 Tax=Dysgonomonas alginatilytica TaxID=1605892 RepID=A0A2V3PR08_9BACT|nr:DEAD/DEAH box helicase family protein [Dysgonomonas alginatilytica]PXV66824.1 hypothetical protein CLV62_10484 [Dysgonomonas alginatilytica]